LTSRVCRVRTLPAEVTRPEKGEVAWFARIVAIPAHRADAEDGRTCRRSTQSRGPLRGTPWPPEGRTRTTWRPTAAQYWCPGRTKIAAYGGDVAVDGRRGHTSRSPSIRNGAASTSQSGLCWIHRPRRHERGAHEATLEVRLSNLPARPLYESSGSAPSGSGPRLLQRQRRRGRAVMNTEPLADAAMRRNRVAASGRHPSRAAPAPGSRSPSAGPRRKPDESARWRRPHLAIESRAPRPGSPIADGSRIAAKTYVAFAGPPCTRLLGRGSCPKVAARAHHALDLPVPRKAMEAHAGASWDDVEAVRGTYGPGCRLDAVGNQLRQGPRLGQATGPLVG